MAINAIVRSGYGTLNQDDILPLVILDRVVETLLGLESGGRHERLGVVQREHIEKDISHDGVRCAQERLTAAGALLEMHPYYGRLLLLLEG
jgi:hypothetical protein